MARKKELIIHIGGNAINFTRAASSVKRSMRQIAAVGHFVGRSLRTAFKYGAIAVGALVGVATAAVRAFAKDEEALERLRSVLRATEGAIGVTEERLREFSAAMEQNTIFADEDVNAMNAVLASFENIKGDNFLEASEAILDMSAALHGTKTSAEQLQATAMQMGRGLNNPAEASRALRSAGIRLTKEQERLIKQMVRAKDVAGAQGVILDILKSKYGGTAAQLRNTFGGSVRYFRNQFGTMMEEIGRGIVTGAKLEGKFNSMGARLRDFAATISGRVAPQVERLAVAIENLFAGGEKREEGKRQLLSMFQDVKAVVQPIFEDVGRKLGHAAGEAFKSAMAGTGKDIAERHLRPRVTKYNPWATQFYAGAAGAGGYAGARDAGMGRFSAAAEGVKAYGRSLPHYFMGRPGEAVDVRIINTNDIKAE